MTKHIRKGGFANARPYETKNDNGGAAEGALSAELKGKLDKVMSTFEELRTKSNDADKVLKDVVKQEELKRIDDALTELKKAFNEEVAALKRLQRGDVKGDVSPELAEYSRKFNEYFRSGGEARESELKDLAKKALAATSNYDPSAGFTVSPEMDGIVDQTVREVSPMRAIASVRTIGTSIYKRLVNVHGAGSGWVGETASRPRTDAASLKELLFPAMTLYANPAATEELLEDSAVNIEQWLADEVSLEFAGQEGTAFITGDGTNKPRGVIGGYTPVANASYAWGSLGFIGTGTSGAFDATNPENVLIDTYGALKAPYRNNSTWIMNRNTMSVIRKWKDGNGRPKIELTYADGGLVERLMGRPIAEMVDMPDLAANSYSIALGDFKRGYLIVDRRGMRVLRDPYSAKPYVEFYTTKRVGGGVSNFEAIKLIKFI